MAKAPRFPCRIDVWCGEEMAATVEALADARALTTSAIVREALLWYLQQIGALSPRPVQPNGQRDPARANEAAA